MNERSIFSGALEITDPRERAAYLGRTCGDDAALRAHVESLLESHQEAGSFLDQPPPQLGRMADTRANVTDTPSLEFLDPCEKPGRIGTLGSHEVIEIAGHGGMGVVLRAHDPKLNRDVAIKVLGADLASNATAVKRFLREARAAAAVSHDHVVTIHAVDDTDGIPFIVMEFVHGRSLQEKIAREGALNVDEIVRIGIQTAAGLEAAHRQGLVHRDIKPSNILLEDGVERVKLTDFGLARAVDDVSLTQTGQLAGTPEYMSPEQAQGRAVDQRTDLFSLGCVLYAMCAGRGPFRAKAPAESLRRVCQDTPRPIQEINPEVPEWLVQLIERLLHKDPARRVQTAREVAILLSRNATNPPLAAATASLPVAAPAVSPGINLVTEFPKVTRKTSVPSPSRKPPPAPSAIQPPSAPSAIQPPPATVQPVAVRTTNPDESNGAAMTGFVLALSGFVTCGLTSPLAIYASIRGLQKPRDRGYAVAGLMLGLWHFASLAVFFLWLFAFGGFALFVGGKVVEAVGEATEFAANIVAEEATASAMSEAEDTIDARVRSQGKLLDEAVANQLLKTHQDGWDSPFRYEVNTTELGGYLLRSMGKDGLLNTADDIIKASPSCAPSTASQAIALLQSPKKVRKEAGLDWVGKATPDASPRREIVQALYTLLDDQDVKVRAIREFPKWASEDDVDELLRMGEDSRSTMSQAVVLNALIEMKHESGVLTFVNCSDFLIRHKAETALEEWDVQDEKILRQTIIDLERRERRWYALQRLDHERLSAAQREDIVETVRGVLASKDLTTENRSRAVRLLVECAEPEDLVQHMIDYHEQSDDSTALEILGKSIDRRALAYLADMLRERPSEDDVFRSLRRIGTIAESFTWPMLKEPAADTRRIGCKLLREIGTERSILHLEPLILDPEADVSRAASRAIEAIKIASREPADPAIPNE